MKDSHLHRVIEHANQYFDGHFTIMKFTTNWRACFGTIEETDQIYFMVSGTTFENALENLLENPVDSAKILEKMGRQ